MTATVTLRLPPGTPVYPRPRTTKGSHPDRAGFCDGYQLREPNNPWKTWPEFFKAQRYNSAYMKGREQRQREIALANMPTVAHAESAGGESSADFLSRWGDHAA